MHSGVTWPAELDFRGGLPQDRLCQSLRVCLVQPVRVEPASVEACHSVLQQHRPGVSKVVALRRTRRKQGCSYERHDWATVASCTSQEL